MNKASAISLCLKTLNKSVSSPVRPPQAESERCLGRAQSFELTSYSRVAEPRGGAALQSRAGTGRTSSDPGDVVHAIGMIFMEAL